MAMVMMFPLSFLNYGRGTKGDVRVFWAAPMCKAACGSAARFGAVRDVEMNNYYLSGFFSEAWLFRCGVISGIVLLGAMAVAAFL